MNKLNIRYVNINQEPVILVDGLTLDDIKAKFPWILNARTKNAILGKNENSLIWYDGEWLCGEWFSGIWYSGIWYTGIWNQGTFNSVKFDRNELLNGNFIITDKNNKYSHFLEGSWESGDFNGGTFGINPEYWQENQNNYIEGNLNKYQSYSITWIPGITGDTIWFDGNFNQGIFINSEWRSGNFKNGEFITSLWYNGSFFDGYFNGDIWKLGNFYGGDFIKGTWENGSFNQINSSIPARFGSTTLNINETLCLWENGTFKNGSFHSGLIQDISGNTISSENHQMSRWLTGTWEFGSWYGGQFETGDWKNGLWYGGIWGTWSTDWQSFTYVYDQDNNWNNPNNIIDSDESTYAYSYNSNIYETLILSGLNFSLNSSYNNQITGVELKIKKSGFYDDIISHGQVNDHIVSLLLDYKSGLTKTVGSYTYTYFYTSGSTQNYIYYLGSGTTTGNISKSLNISLFNINPGDVIKITLQTYNTLNLSSVTIGSPFNITYLPISGTSKSFYMYNNTTGVTYNTISLSSTFGLNPLDLINYQISQSIKVERISQINKYNGTPFSKDQSLSSEIVKYGGYSQYWGLETTEFWTGLTLDHINNLQLLYTIYPNRSNKTSSTFKVESRIYDILIRIYHQTKPNWFNGIWFNGLWINGNFWDGKFIGGIWVNGTFYNGNFEY